MPPSAGKGEGEGEPPSAPTPGDSAPRKQKKKHRRSLNDSSAAAAATAGKKRRHHSRTGASAAGGGAKRSKKRARVVDLTVPGRSSGGATELLPFEISDVPNVSALLDQVVACTAGCAVLGTRLEVVYEPKQKFLAVEHKANTAALREDMRNAHVDDQRRKDAGESVPRRSRYLDDIAVPDRRSLDYHRVQQLWAGEHQKDRICREDTDLLSAGNEHVCFVTHQVISRVEVIFKGRGRYEEREKGTKAHPCELVVRLIATADCVLEVRYLLSEERIHAIQLGIFAHKEHGANYPTWLANIPFELGMPGQETIFHKTIKLYAPSDCSTVLDEDLLILRQALCLNRHSDAVSMARVFATNKFQRALRSPTRAEEVDNSYHYRWLQFTPFGKSAWDADDAQHLEEFYEA